MRSRVNAIFVVAFAGIRLTYLYSSFSPLQVPPIFDEHMGLGSLRSGLATLFGFYKEVRREAGKERVFLFIFPYFFLPPFLTALPTPLLSPRQPPANSKKKRKRQPLTHKSSSTNFWLTTSYYKPTTCCSTMTALVAGRAAVDGRKSFCKCTGFWGTSV